MRFIVRIAYETHLANYTLYTLVHETATYRCDDTRGCVMQFWPPDDEHMCSKHEEAWNKLIVKQKYCASSWLITEINNGEVSFKKMNWFNSRYLNPHLWTNDFVVVLFPGKQISADSNQF